MRLNTGHQAENLRYSRGALPLAERGVSGTQTDANARVSIRIGAMACTAVQ